MKNKKGFTLIELLAVIVILAIIALIVTPLVLNTIEKSRKNSAKDSMYGYVEAIESQNALYQLDSTKYQEVTSGDVTSINSKIKVKGSKPTSGTVTIEKGTVTSATLCVNGYTVTYNGKEVTNTEKGCNKSSSSSSPYVYSLNKITNASDGSSTRPANPHIYLRYELTDGEIASGTKEEYCIYSDVINDELCLKHGEYETSVQKIKTFFGYNSSTWTGVVEYEGTPDESTAWTNSVNDFSCDEYNSRGSFDCGDFKYRNENIEDGIYVVAEAYSNGVVVIKNMTKTGDDVSWSVVSSN